MTSINISNMRILASATSVREISAHYSTSSNPCANVTREYRHRRVVIFDSANAFATLSSRSDLGEFKEEQGETERLFQSIHGCHPDLLKAPPGNTDIRTDMRFRPVELTVSIGASPTSNWVLTVTTCMIDPPLRRAPHILLSWGLTNCLALAGGVQSSRSDLDHAKFNRRDTTILPHDHSVTLAVSVTTRPKE